MTPSDLYCHKWTICMSKHRNNVSNTHGLITQLLLSCYMTKFRCSITTNSWPVYQLKVPKIQNCSLETLVRSFTEQKGTIHQVTTMLATSKIVLFPGHNHLPTTGTDDPSLIGTLAIIKVSHHQYRWLAGDYDLEIEHF